MKFSFALTAALLLGGTDLPAAGPFPGPVGSANTTAISKDDQRILSWATTVTGFSPGPIDISDPDAPLASFGAPGNALGPADALDPQNGVVSLGDGGSITLSFAQPIIDGPGFDFAVFENGFSDTYLELAFVEVAGPDGVFVRFNCTSLTQTATQISQSDVPFSGIDATNIDGLAGKYRQLFGTPFDLASVGLQQISFVRLVDVVGSIDPQFGTKDSFGHMINDPWPSLFATAGFDLDAVAVLHQVPEPNALSLLIGGVMLAATRRMRSPRRTAR